MTPPSAGDRPKKIPSIPLTTPHLAAQNQKNVHKYKQHPTTGKKNLILWLYNVIQKTSHIKKGRNPNKPKLLLHA